MRCLITGGNGFVGRYLIRALKERHPGVSIRIFQRSEAPDLSRRGVEVIRGDLADAPAVSEACVGVDAVFHVGAKAGIWGSRREYHRVNVIGTRNVLFGCKALGVRYLIYTSTPSVVFGGKPIRGGDETLPYPESWSTAYAQTKAMAEQAVLEAHDDGGLLHTLALRPHLVWGAGDPHLVPRVLSRARSGRLRIVGEGDNWVDLTHVRNVAHAHVLALDALLARRTGGKAYFVSDGRPVKLWEWINRLLGEMEIPPVTRSVPLNAARRAGAFLEGLYRVLRVQAEPPMTRFVALQLGEDHWFDISAARDELGYTPVISNAEGMEELVRRLRAEEPAPSA